MNSSQMPLKPLCRFDNKLRLTAKQSMGLLVK